MSALGDALDATRQAVRRTVRAVNVLVVGIIGYGLACVYVPPWVAVAGMAVIVAYWSRHRWLDGLTSLLDDVAAVRGRLSSADERRAARLAALIAPHVESAYLAGVARGRQSATADAAGDDVESDDAPVVDS